MKNQASLSLQIVDDPISEKASDGCLAIRFFGKAGHDYAPADDSSRGITHLS